MIEHGLGKLNNTFSVNLSALWRFTTKSAFATFYRLETNIWSAWPDWAIF